MTHVEAQRIIRESPTGVELLIERNLSFSHSNEFHASEENGHIPDDPLTSSRIHTLLDDDTNNNGSWSSDSTSTGSTTIHVSSLNSDDPLTSESEGVWSPSNKKRANLHLNLNLPKESSTQQTIQPPAKTDKSKLVVVEEENESSPIWQPFGAPYDGPQFRPVKLGVTRTKMTSSVSQSDEPKKTDTDTTEHAKTESPKADTQTKDASKSSSSSSSSRKHSEKTKTTTEKSQTTTTTAETMSTNSVPFTKTGWGSHLPPSQSPTITLLQKAREGQLPKGAVYIEEKSDTTPIPKNAVLIDQKVTVEGDKVHTDSYYAVPTLSTETTTHNIKAPSKYDGIGPTEYGIPVGLRTGVKEEYASDWYKSMYKSLHRNKFPKDSNQTVHVGGYMSEPEFERKDKLKSKYSTDYRRKPEKSVSYTTETSSSEHAKSDMDTSVVRHEPKREAYRVEPRSIAEYEPGRSSLAEREFQKQQEYHLGGSPKPNTHAGLNRRWHNILLSDGYESDSTLIRKTGRPIEVEPDQQKAWYKEIQKGGEIPLTGLQKTVPEKPTASAHQYQETEVNIHFKSPIRHLEKEHIEEEELRKRQEETMRKLYEEERRKKYQQELAEMEMRRHSDFFTPSQKSPIALNRYDNPFEYGQSRLAPPGHGQRGPPPKTMARAVYPFTSQTTRELGLNKGDIVYINKQIDRYWYEGEHHGLVGIFPIAYVEIIPSEKANLQPRKAAEGEAIVKYNFRAQTPAELSLFKGERVVLTRRIDHNWFEGRLGAKKGIFPICYVEVLQEPGDFFSGNRSVSPKPPASPVFSPIVNGSIHKILEGPTFNTGLRPLQNKPPLHADKYEAKTSLMQSLHIDTYNEPIPYRSLYAYAPQNDDELELREGDTVYVMEKCDDGWYVGTSLRTGLFGTFPGNYVERI